jgi:hypothetical protein
MQNNGVAPPPATRPEYETAEDAYQGEEAAPGLADFASKAMETPSRYDSDLIKDITAQIDAELEQKKLYAGTELDEFMSQRGMVGSSVEGELRKSMLGDMERQRQERLNELNIRAADAWAADQTSAADIGFKSAEFQRALGGDRENAARYEAEFGQSQYEFDKMYGQGAWGNRIEEKRLELMEKGMDMDDAYRKAMSEVQTEQFAETLGEERAARMQRHGIDVEALAQETRRIENEEKGLTLQEARDKAEINLRLEQLQAQKEETGEAFELDRERIRIQNEQFKDRLGLEQLQYEEQRAARIATIGLSSRELDQAAERLQLDALVQGRTLDLQEARSLAEMEFRIDELSQTMGLEQARLKAQDNQFQAQHEQNAAQWADSLGMQQAQYEEAVAARHAEYEDRRGARLDEMGLQKGTLEHETMQNSLNRTLEREALRLQNRGLDEESAWRLADRIQQGRLEDKALDIQKNGISEEAAWRNALNESNERMQQAQLTSQKDLMDLGIGADAARDLTRESHEAAMNAANIASTEKIEGLARILQESGLDAETAWRAASDASNQAMNNANNAAQSKLQEALLKSDKTLQASRVSSAEKMQKAGLDSDAARDLTRELHETAMNTASLTNAKDIADANNTARSKLEKALQEAGIDAAEAAATAKATVDETFATARDAAATTAASAAATHQKSMNTANNNSREQIQAIIRDTVGDQISADESWRSAQRTHEQTLSGMDMTIAREEMEVKKWATKADLDQRAWEFENANNTERLKMTLTALATDKVDVDLIKSWMGKYPATKVSEEGTENSVALARLQQALDDAERDRDYYQAWWEANKDKKGTKEPEGSSPCPPGQTLQDDGTCAE